MEHTTYRPTWIEIDLKAITYNIHQLLNILPKNTKIMAVVKADGYGHGMIQVARTAIESGAEALAVALLEEAIELRKANIKVPILVLGWVSPVYVKLAADYEITLTVFQHEWLKELSTHTLTNPLKIHLKFDTGMGRIGVRTHEELTRILTELQTMEKVALEGIYTHFATADEEDLSYYKKQEQTFQQFLQSFHKLWKKDVIVHTGNSAASLRFPKKMHHYVRTGISMYGLYPSTIVKEEEPLQLKQSFSLHSRLIHVKKIKKGEHLSYGIEYEAKDDEWIGTVPIGYGDGWLRRLQGFSVLIGGKRHPIVGRICMDQLMVRLDQPYPVGEKVTLIGKQGEERIEMDEVADYLQTINYEIPCIINRRIPRRYV